MMLIDGGAYLSIRLKVSFCCDQLMSVVHHYPLYLSTIDSIIIHLAPMTLDIPPDP